MLYPSNSTHSSGRLITHTEIKPSANIEFDFIWHLLCFLLFYAFLYGVWQVFLASMTAPYWLLMPLETLVVGPAACTGVVAHYRYVYGRIPEMSHFYLFAGMAVTLTFGLRLLTGIGDTWTFQWTMVVAGMFTPFQGFGILTMFHVCGLMIGGNFESEWGSGL